MGSLTNILWTGRAGMSAAQQAMNVVGQNVANVDTPGYSRQRTDQVALQSQPFPGLYTGYDVQLSGVDVAQIERVKNDFIQAVANSAVAKQSALQGQVDPLNTVQTALTEPSDTGIQAGLDTFFHGWTTLANSPTPANSTAGNLVLSNAAALTNQLNTLSTAIESEWNNQLATLGGVVDQVNAAAAQVADLNTQIVEGGVNHLTVNDLLDKRDAAVNTLSKLVGASAQVGVNGQINVSISGVALVQGGLVAPLSLAGGGSISVVDTDPPQLMIGSVVATPSLGQAAGILSALRSDLPTVSTQLDGVASSLITIVNTQHNAGFTLNGDAGGDFFTGTGARDIAVALTSADQIAVSATAGSHDGSNAAKIADLANDNTASAALGGGPGPTVQYRTLTALIGTKIQSLNTALSSQTAIVTSTQNAVDSDSGVNLDEELTNMLLYQRAYQASAKIITAADDMLQTLIAMVR
jgi:flagellar hook-associated protein 1 FlgK